MSGTTEHWDAAYALGETTRSWYQDQARLSLAMVERCGVTPSSSVIDVGAGASVFVDDLLDHGFTDLTALDISAAALTVASARLGAAASTVTWVAADLLTWTPRRTFDVWHDRAVLHFLTEGHDRDRYRVALDAATHPGSVVVIAAFAPDGPQTCSGLPVRRYDVDDIAALLETGWSLVAEDREEHTTPSGGVQPFTWAAFRRSSRG